MAAENKPFTRKDLESLILDYMDREALPPIIKKHIDNLVLNNGMSCKEIARCVCWYVEEAGKEISPIYGLSFVLNIREDAAAYFKKLELDQQKQVEAAEKLVKYQDNNIIFNIKKLPKKVRKPKQFDVTEIVIVDEKDGVSGA